MFNEFKLQLTRPTAGLRMWQYGWYCLSPLFVLSFFLSQLFPFLSFLILNRLSHCRANMCGFKSGIDIHGGEGRVVSKFRIVGKPCSIRMKQLSSSPYGCGF